MISILRRLLAVAPLILLVCSGCGKPVPNIAYVIDPATAGAMITDADRDTVKTVLDEVATQNGMTKVWPREANVLRCYQPTGALEIGFFARDYGTHVTVFASPLMQSVARDATYQAFRRTLESKLRTAFGNRLRTEVQ
jgi:hypothetical protein